MGEKQLIFINKLQCRIFRTKQNNNNNNNYNNNNNNNPIEYSDINKLFDRICTDLYDVSVAISVCSLFNILILVLPIKFKANH